jgi:predicted N-acetyltransferase YhbS
MIQYIYNIENSLSLDEFRGILDRSTLALRRPVEELDTLQGMLDHADLIATARDSTGLLVGVARALTDFSYCTYLSDLAVDQAHQKRGIGIRLIQRIHDAAGRQTHLILLAAPAAEAYYPRIGFQPHHSCWMIPRQVSHAPET